MATGFGFVIALTFTLNYIIGTGFLTLPWAFFASGNLLATLVLMFVTFLAACSILMILESMARAAAISPNTRNNKTSSFPNYAAIPSTLDATEDRNATCDSVEGTLWVVGERRIEIVELCQHFYPSGRPYFIAILSVYMYGALWAYCTVFSNALATASPIFGDNSYYFYLFLYALVVVPMSCLELSEQVAAQVIFAICRVVMVVSMLGSVAYATYDSGENELQMDEDSSFDMTHLVKWSGFKIIVPIALYSNIFHHSIPALSEIVFDKKLVGWVYMTTLAICFVAYTVIGISLSSYFGSTVSSSSNLNWSSFYLKNKTMMWTIVSNYIILFPAVDVVSAFPLSAITLGNNIQSFSEKDNLEVSRFEMTKSRCIASIPPVLGACFITDLGEITKYTGITGFFIVFFYPVILSQLSHNYLVDRGMSPRTYYTCLLTSTHTKALLVLFGVFMIFLTLFTQ